MSEHHEFSPSKFPAWQQCPCFDSKEVGEAAKEGSRLHEFLALVLTGCATCDDEGVTWAANYIKGIAAVKKLEVETKLEYFASPDDFEPMYFGTADAIYKENIFDYKSGDVHDYDAQMAGYALALMQRDGLSKVNIHILYGRTMHAATFTIDELTARIMVSDIIAARQNPKRVPAACDYCAWCSHAATCPALTNRALAVAQGREDWKLENFHASEITKPSEMGKALKLARFLKDWIESVEFHAREMALKQGENIPGFKVKSTTGRRSIADTVEAFKLSGMQAQDFIALCSVGVGDLERVVGKKDFAVKFATILKKSSDSISLVAEKEKDNAVHSIRRAD